MSRLLKQIIIIIVFFLIIGVIVGGFIYLGRDKSSCFDGIKNGNEEGIDCGEACAKSCPILIPEAKELKAVNIQAIKSGDTCDIIATIDNPNLSLGGQKIPYSIEWGSAIDKGTFYIFPNETRYLLSFKQSCQEGKKLSVNIGSPAEWELFKNYEKPRLDITNRNFQYLQNNYEFAEVTGIVVNNSPFDLVEIEVYAVLRANNNEVVGVNKTTVNSILIGERREFRMVWNDSLPGKVAKIEIFTTSNLFNSHNFMQQQGITSSLEGDVKR